MLAASRPRRARRHEALGDAAKVTTEMLAEAATAERSSESKDASGRRLEELLASLREICGRLRPTILQRTAAGVIDAHSALAQLEALRWLERVSHHLYRAAHHLSEGSRDDAALASAPDAAADSA